MNSDGGSASQPAAPPAEAKKNSKRPKESRFLQQELPACKPLLTPQWVISIYMLVAIIFIPIGVVSLLASRSVVEIVDRYDQSCVPSNTSDKVAFIQSATTNKTCIQSITVPKHMKQPIYVYYELDNFYQNHRRYVKSRSDSQLLNGHGTDTSNCKPEQYLKDNSSFPITPCGLIAWSFFNDTYNFMINGSSQLKVNKKGISWKSDREHKFGSNVMPQNFPNNQNESGVWIGGGKLDPNTPLSEDEDLIVWMRTAALPTFRKLYGKIEEDLQANTIISINITNVYNTYSFDGKKKLVLSTTSWLGGKNDFLGIAYLTVGCLSVLLALVFLAAHLRSPRPLGDTSYLSWNRKEAQKEEAVRS